MADMADTELNPYAGTLDDLERSVRVPLEDQTTAQAEPPAEGPLSEAELDVQRLLGVTGAGRLR